jgi:hypothetical protein
VPPAINATNSLWIFASCSQEPRHLYDILFAVSVLRKLGVPDARIRIFLDHDHPAQHLAPYGLSAEPFGQLAASVAAAPSSEAAIAVIGGHGMELGLQPKGSAQPFQAAALFAAIRSVPGIQVGIVALTQCFGGIYNYANADDKPPLVVMGGASLNLSLSMTVQLTAPLIQSSGAVGLKEWAANVFSYDLFEWIANPRDVDGDGAITVMDAYKYAGAHSNGRVRESKLGAFVRAFSAVEPVKTAAAELSGALALTPAPPDLQLKKLQFAAAHTTLQQEIEFLYSNHEPWILNARLAREVKFAF